jgi:hypothetical protein
VIEQAGRRLLVVVDTFILMIDHANFKTQGMILHQNERDKKKKEKAEEFMVIMN